MKFCIYFILAFILMIGIVLFNYAFPHLSLQQSMAATLSIYCFSFFTAICIKYGLSDNNDKK
jgi:hypothetical protein